MRRLFSLAAVLILGCSAPNINHGGGASGGSGGGGAGGAGGAGGTGGSGGAGGSGGTGGAGGTGGSGGSGGTDCPPEAKLVYIIDSNGTFSSFAPNQKDVTQSIVKDLGKLSCPAMSGANPFSMSVDRSGTAWVEYIAADQNFGTFQSGELFTVPTTDITKCTATSYMAPQSGYEEFGMGFVADAPMATAETLFIAGGAAPTILDMTPAVNLGTFDTKSFKITQGASINGRPELTGTGDAKLWAFFPDATNPRISQLDKMAGTESGTLNLDTLKGMPKAWAFAFWGGDFWVFLMKDKEKSTTVYHVVGGTGAITSWPMPGGRTIVGAGVSTCAPTTPIS